MNHSSTQLLVQQAADLASSSERSAFLDRACAGDAALRARVEDLLEASKRTGLPPAGSADAETESEIPTDPRGLWVRTTEKPGSKIGRYRLLQQIGEGGCGTVYLAEQEEPVRRQVALKVIKLGMDTRHVVSRFEVERQALALMDHPHIAKVLDAGATESGSPFFVMELVRGVSITSFCDENGLTTRERIELLVKVCQAIQHAHQKGVIHRDIKPSNILVSLQDGVASPKVIDFGIAKAIDESLAVDTMLTPHQAFIGTPAYASPEQAATGGLDVDTRSDVYSLGAVLYELLTGCQPFDRDQLIQGGLAGVRRTISDVEPLRPSTRLRSLQHARLADIAQTRHAEAASLSTLVRGDLDWIVMKCLEKDRARRYETANGLAADLKRHLNHEPVTARPPSTGYVLQKLMRKHRLAFVAGGAVAASLVIGLAFSTWLFIRERAAKQEQEMLQKEANASARRADTNAEKARTSAAKSRQVSSFMKEMIESVGPVAMASESTMWRQVVDKAAERLGQQRLHPSVEWEVRTTLGEVYFSLGQKREATEMLRQSLRLARQTTDLGPTKVTESLVSLGWILNQSGQPVAAEPLLREALDLAARHLDKDDPKLTWIKSRIGWNLMDLGHLDEAEPLCREALEKAREHWHDPDESREPMPGSLASYATGLAYVMQLRGRRTEAESLFREAVDAAERDKGFDHPELSGWIKNLASFLRGEVRDEEAESLYRRALELDKKHAPNHPRQIGAAGNLALLMLERGDATGAGQIISKLIATAKSLPEADRLSWANNLAAVGANAAQFGHWDEAASLFQAAEETGSDTARLPAFRVTIAAQRKDPAALRTAHSDFLSRAGKDGQAVVAVDLATVFAHWSAAGAGTQAARRLGELALDSTGTKEWNALARALASYRLGVFGPASTLARSATNDANSWSALAGQFLLAQCLQQTGKPQEARAALASGREVLARWPGTDAAHQKRKWIDMTIAQALLHEAETVIEGASSAKTP